MCYSSSSVMGSDQLTSIIAFLELQAQICHELLIPSHTLSTVSCLLLHSCGIGTIHFLSIVYQLLGPKLVQTGCNKSATSRIVSQKSRIECFFSKVKLHVFGERPHTWNHLNMFLCLLNVKKKKKATHKQTSRKTNKQTKYRFFFLTVHQHSFFLECSRSYPHR